MRLTQSWVDFLPIEMLLVDDSLDTLGQYTELQAEILNSGPFQVVTVDLLFGKGGEATVNRSLSIVPSLEHTLLLLNVLKLIVEVKTITNTVILLVDFRVVGPVALDSLSHGYLIILLGVHTILCIQRP